jgi:catalase-peroxidase
MILAGDEAMRDMGFKTLGVAGGRVDDWTPDLVYWGPEDKFLASHRFDENGNLMPPLAASVMGLIYVNPEGADGKPDPKLSANHIRITFGRMGMNDEETVALIAGGHTFGKTHGAHNAAKCVTGPAPAGAPVEDQAAGWKNRCGKGNAEDTITSGLEGSWTPEPTKWTHDYLTNLYKYNWKLHKGPGGKFQWFADNLEADDLAPDAHLNKKVPIMMLTTDLALRFDPQYNAIATRFLKNPDEFSTAFARAWFKLVHRDLGPKSRYLGNDFPQEDFIWQDPTTARTGKLVNDADVAHLKEQVIQSKMAIADMVKTAWAAAATYRGTDRRGGVNGARIRLAPQKDWEVNEPALLQKNLATLQAIQEKFNSDNSVQGKSVSLADLIVIAGNAGVEQGAKNAGVSLIVPFTPGRNDATQAQTDVQAFQFLKVGSDGFRNYFNEKESYLAPAQAFIDRADLMTLTVPEMTVLTGGLRVLGANYQNSKNGVFTDRVGTLTNDFFVHLMDSSIVWTLGDKNSGIFNGKDRQSGKQRWTATTHDLIFGSSSELRVVAFAYASPTAKSRFVRDFVRAWNKVMNLDRFDVVTPVGNQ